MIFMGDYYVEGLCHMLFVLTNIIVVATAVMKIKQRVTQPATVSTSLVSLCSLSVWLGGKTSPTSHTAGPCASGNRVEIPRA